MKPSYRDTRFGYAPALENNEGKCHTAPFTTFDLERAKRYAEVAAALNAHEDMSKIIWPDHNKMDLTNSNFFDYSRATMQDIHGD